MTCAVKIYKEAAKIYLLSGKSIFRLGSYDQCSQDPLMTYNMISLALKKDPTQFAGFIGVCLPKQCLNSTVKSIINYVLQKNAFAPVTVKTVQNKFQNIFSYDWTFYLTIFIILFAISALVMGTWLKIKPENHLIVGNFNLSQSLKIFEKRKSDLNIFNGIKALGMMWIIFGSTYQIASQININIATLQVQQAKWSSLLVTGAIFAIDVFFFLAGFLFAYTIVRQRIKNNWFYLIAIFHRALRFWPSYFICIMIFYSILIHLNSGPVWSFLFPTVNDCSSIWRPLLFVDNLIENGRNECLSSWGWYLQNDMQIFIVLITITFIMSINKLAGKLLALIVMFGSTAYYFVFAHIHEVKLPYNRQKTELLNDGDSFDQHYDLYIKPWARAGPYIFGYFLGMMYLNFLQDQKKNTKRFLSKIKYLFRKSKLFRVATQLIGLSIMLFLVFIGRLLQINGNDYWPQVVHSLFLSSARMGYVFGLTLLILPSLLGIKGTIVRSILDTNFFNFVAKISFCTYLIHAQIIIWSTIGRHYDNYLTFQSTLVKIFFHIVVSLFFGFWLTMLIEVPFSKFQRLLINKLKQKQKQKQRAQAVQNQQTKKLFEQQMQMNMRLNQELNSESSNGKKHNKRYKKY